MRRVRAPAGAQVVFVRVRVLALFGVSEVSAPIRARFYAVTGDIADAAIVVCGVALVVSLAAALVGVAAVACRWAASQF